MLFSRNSSRVTYDETVMSGGVCHTKNKERGIYFEIQCLQELVDSPTARDEDKKLAKKILKCWSKVSDTTRNTTE